MHIPYTQFITCCFVGQRLYYNITMLNRFLIELAAKKFWPPARARRKGGVGGIPPRPSVPPERSGGGQFPSKNVRVELYNSTNIKLSDFCPTDSAARSAERYGNTGSPSAGSKSLAILSICFAQLKNNKINL